MGNVGHDDDTPVDGIDDRTPTVMNPCPDCGDHLVVIGIPGVLSPKIGPEIWLTVFGRFCVQAREWRWCRRAVAPDGTEKGHLEAETDVWVAKP